VCLCVCLCTMPPPILVQGEGFHVEELTRLVQVLGVAVARAHHAFYSLGGGEGDEVRCACDFVCVGVCVCGGWVRECRFLCFPTHTLSLLLIYLCSSPALGIGCDPAAAHFSFFFFFPLPLLLGRGGVYVCVCVCIHPPFPQRRDGRSHRGRGPCLPGA